MRGSVVSDKDKEKLRGLVGGELAGEGNLKMKGNRIFAHVR